MQRATLITPPAVEPVSLGQAKLHLRVDYDSDDTLISTLITAARQICETRLRQALITQTWLYMIDDFPWGGGYYNRQIRREGPSQIWLPSNTGILQLPRPPVQSIVSIQYYDYNSNLNTIPANLYNFSVGTPSRIQPVFGSVWPIAQPRIDAVQITYVCGYGSDATAVPLAIQQAMLLLIGHYYENRQQVTQGAPNQVLPEAVDALLATFDHGEYA